jgi:hypothetical protein
LGKAGEPSLIKRIEAVLMGHAVIPLSLGIGAWPRSEHGCILFIFSGESPSNPGGICMRSSFKNWQAYGIARVFITAGDAALVKGLVSPR